MLCGRCCAFLSSLPRLSLRAFLSSVLRLAPRAFLSSLPHNSASPRISVLFSAPSNTVSGWGAQLDRLVNVPVVSSIVNLPLVRGVVQGLLPSLVLRIFLAVLPYLLEGLALWEGVRSLSAIQFETMSKYFAFQVGAP
jgi:Calcium-dependent channel, 7TM region, putative phosphate